jgi:hypothetical protein
MVKKVKNRKDFKMEIGDRVELVYTSDKYTKLKPGDRGTIRLIDDMKTVHIKWDNGEGLGMIPGEDEIKVITERQEKIERVLKDEN